MAVAKKKNRKPRGVTLMEILVAMVILTIGLYMVYNIFPMGFAASYRSRNRTIAMQLAQQKLESILDNESSTGCLSTSGTTCRFRPIEDSYTTPDYPATFDCRYFYGTISNITGTTPIKNGTYCKYHSGDISVATNWKRFSQDDPSLDPNFWYNVEITACSDRALKYRSLGDMARITVRVRGPIDDMTKWGAVTGPQRRVNRLPVEVLLSTLKANTIIPVTRINRSYAATNYRNGVYDTGAAPIVPTYDPTNPENDSCRRVRVNNIRNFTMFSNVGLAGVEKTDQSLVIDATNGTPINTGNLYGLDNVLIVRYDANGNPYSYQTNKIMKIIPDLTVNPATTESIPGDIVFCKPLYVDLREGTPTDKGIVKRTTYLGPPYAPGRNPDPTTNPPKSYGYYQLYSAGEGYDYAIFQYVNVKKPQ